MGESLQFLEPLQPCVHCPVPRALLQATPTHPVLCPGFQAAVPQAGKCPPTPGGRGSPPVAWGPAEATAEQVMGPEVGPASPGASTLSSSQGTWERNASAAAIRGKPPRISGHSPFQWMQVFSCHWMAMGKQQAQWQSYSISQGRPDPLRRLHPPEPMSQSPEGKTPATHAPRAP